MRGIAILALLAWASACYTGARATRDANALWRGRSQTELVARWGKPTTVEAQDDGATALIWTRRGHRIEQLPSGSFRLQLDEHGLDAELIARPGVAVPTESHVVALIDTAGVVAAVRGWSLRLGIPDGVNMRWGFLFGVHAGMGRLDDTSTPLPSGGLYIGGMLTRTVGLVGTFSMVSGTDDDGGAIGFAWGLGAQWWPSMRTSVRAGPAMVLAFDPGFEDAGLEPGVNGGASYALIKSGSFVFDVRLDLTAGTSTRFGSLGVGVNVN